MRILIYGAGVIGSIFAGKLAASGQDITVLARGKRAEELRKDGVILSVPGAKKREITRVHVIEKLDPDDRYDYILVVMQRAQVDEVLQILARNQTKNLVFVVNTAAGYDPWVEAVGSDRLMLGFPSAGGERRDGKVSYFIGKGLLRAFQTTTFGEYGGEYSGESGGKKTARVLQLIRAFRHAGIPSVFCADMDAWQKTHVVMITSIANALYAYDCDNYRLSHAYADVRLMVKGIREGFTVLKRLGYGITPAKLQYFMLPDWLVARVFKVVMGTRLAEITMAKHCIAAKAELACLQAEVDALVAQSGIATPAMDKLREKGAGGSRA